MISADLFSVLMRGIQARHLDWGAGADAVAPGEEAFSRLVEEETASAGAKGPDGAAPFATVPARERGPEFVSQEAVEAEGSPAEEVLPACSPAVPAITGAAPNRALREQASSDELISETTAPKEASPERTSPEAISEEISPEEFSSAAGFQKGLSEEVGPEPSPTGAVGARQEIAAQIPTALARLDRAEIPDAERVRQEASRTTGGAPARDEIGEATRHTGARVGDGSPRPDTGDVTAPAVAANDQSDASRGLLQGELSSPEVSGDRGAPAERTQHAPPAPVGSGAAPVLAGTAPVASAPSPALAPGEAKLGWRLSVEAPESAMMTAREGAAAPAGVPSGPANAVAGQVAMAIRASESDRIEIRLDPPELGRVQIEMRVVEGALHAVVVAERAEVSDFLRRHAEMLQRDLENAGYGDVSLDFAAGRQDGSERRNRTEEAARGLDVTAAAPVPARPARAPGDSRLDIRL